MKRSFSKYILFTLSLLAVGGGEAMATVDFGEEVVISTETTWTFNDYENGQLGVVRSGVIYPFTQVDGLYARCITDNASYTVGDVTPQNLVFSDGYVVRIVKAAHSENDCKTNEESLQTFTAGNTSNANVRPFFAFNASVAGTCYAYVKSNGTNQVRVFFNNGSSYSNAYTTSDEITEIKYTSTEAGTFFIGGVTANESRDIYAIRFVPTSVADKSSIVYIGSTGYATFGNRLKWPSTQLDVPTLPAGLSAYSARAAADGHSVILTSLDKLRRAQGYILRGTPNTNYRLNYGGDTLAATYNGVEMTYVAADIENFAASVIEDATTYYQYILAAEDGVAKFFEPDGTSTLKAGKAYLKTRTALSPAAGSRGIRIVFEDMPTNVYDIRSTEVDDNILYNQQGRMVTKPSKGIYIRNGKKFIVK